jgi:Flp pilus assembly protein TadG
MALFSIRHNQDGAIFVEAALVLPILLLVTFAGAFFFLCAARFLSLQMAANEMAKDLSVALHDPEYNGLNSMEKTCIAGCKATLPNYPWRDQLGPLQRFNVDVGEYVEEMYDAANGCWNACAESRYRLITRQYGRSSYLTVEAQVFPAASWYDQEITNPNTFVASPGDYFIVTLRYPLRAVWGGGITFFGLAPNTSLVGTAVGVLEKRV